MNNILITICARGGSKGIPGKNIKELNGKPLIYYTINTNSIIARVVAHNNTPFNMSLNLFIGNMFILTSIDTGIIE